VAVVNGLDLYKVVQVDPEAEIDVIRAADRSFAARYHPGADGSAQRMTELNGAWAVLPSPLTPLALDRGAEPESSVNAWSDEPTSADSALWMALGPSDHGSTR
jgi:DnaJ-class molecular chaperone